MSDKHEYPSIVHQIKIRKGSNADIVLRFSSLAGHSKKDVVTRALALLFSSLKENNRLAEIFDDEVAIRLNNGESLQDIFKSIKEDGVKKVRGLKQEGKKGDKDDEAPPY